MFNRPDVAGSPRPYSSNFNQTSKPPVATNLTSSSLPTLLIDPPPQIVLLLQDRTKWTLKPPPRRSSPPPVACSIFKAEVSCASQTLTNMYDLFVPSPLTRSCVSILLVTRLDPFADADFGSGSSPSSAQAGAKANASRTGTPKIDDDLGGVAGGKIHIS